MVCIDISGVEVGFIYKRLSVIGSYVMVILVDVIMGGFNYDMAGNGFVNVLN